MHLVFLSSKHGFLGWPLKLMPGAQQSKSPFFEFVFSGAGPSNRPWIFGTIEGIEEWRVVEANVLPPLAAKRSNGDFRIPSLIITGKGKGVPLLQAAARQGFAHMSVHFMTLLFDKLSVKFEGKKPRAEMSLLTALVKHALGDVSDDEMSAIVARRGKQGRDPCVDSDLLKPGVMEALGHLAWGSDEQEFRQALDRHSSAQNASGSAKGASVANANRIPESAKRVPDVGDDVDVEVARTFLPSAKGCSLTKETHWHFRWKVTYLVKPDPPFSHSQGWVKGDREGCSRALRAVLAWAWREHSSQTGADLPFEF